MDPLGQEYGQGTTERLVSASGCLGPQLGGLKQLGVTSHAWGRIWRRLYSQVLLQNWLEVWVHLGVSSGAHTHMAFLTWWSQGGKSAF